MANYSSNKVVNILLSWQTGITDVLPVIMLSCILIVAIQLLGK